MLFVDAINDIAAQLGQINGPPYSNNFGNNIFVGRKTLLLDELPAISINPGLFSLNVDSYGEHFFVLPLSIEAIKRLGGSISSQEALGMQLDIYQALFGEHFLLEFSGGSYAFDPNDFIGASVVGIGFTAFISEFVHNSGDFGIGNATGTFDLVQVDGEISTGPSTIFTENGNGAFIAGNWSYLTDRMLQRKIEYVDSYVLANPDESSEIVSIQFNVFLHQNTKKGNVNVE